MPTGEVARKFFERLAVVETQVHSLITYQKWQMGILAAILAGLALNLFK